MKNIIFVIADLGMGGAQRVVSLLAKGLAADADVAIVTMGSSQQASFFDIPAAVTIHYAGATGHSQGMFSALSANLSRIIKLRQILKSLSPDVVISFQTETNCTSLLAMIGTGIPVLISERSDPYIHPQSPVWRFIRRVVYPLAYGGIFQTRHAAHFFSGMMERQAVIFNPVATDEDMSADVPAVPYILGVGRLSEEKGFSDLIAAHAIAVKSCPDLKLVLVGDGPESSRLIKQAQELGTSDQVIFAGPQNKLADYYRSALAFVLPSRFEGLPNALLEALAYGCVAISTPLFAAAPEIITHGENGLIAENGSPQALATQIIFSYDNKERRLELRKNASISAARFKEDLILQQWMQFIHATP